MTSVGKDGAAGPGTMGLTYGERQVGRWGREKSSWLNLELSLKLKGGKVTKEQICYYYKLV